MNAGPPSRAAKLSLALLTVILTSLGPAGPGAAAGPPVLTLPKVRWRPLRRCRR